MFSADITVEELISQVQNAFLPALEIPKAYLLCEYNALLRALYLSLPGGDETEKIEAENGLLPLSGSPARVRRVFFGDRELLHASPALLGVLPDYPLFCPAPGGLQVPYDGEYTLLLRALPAAVTSADAASCAVMLENEDVPMMRAYLFHRAYLYAADGACANLYGAEYNRLLEEFRRARGVLRCADED